MIEIRCDSCRAGLTAPQAIQLAEAALKEGRFKTAECYVTVAYAIMDANVARHAALTRTIPGENARR